MKAWMSRALDKPAYWVNYENIRQDTHFISIPNHNQNYAFNIISKRNGPENILFLLLFTHYENRGRDPKIVWVCSFTKMVCRMVRFWVISTQNHLSPGHLRLGRTRSGFFFPDTSDQFSGINARLPQNHFGSFVPKPSQLELIFLVFNLI